MRRKAQADRERKAGVMLAESEKRVADALDDRERRTFGLPGGWGTPQRAGRSAVTNRVRTTASR